MNMTTAIVVWYLTTGTVQLYGPYNSRAACVDAQVMYAAESISVTNCIPFKVEIRQ